METNNSDKVISRIIYLPMIYYNSDYSWSELVDKTGYFNIDSELITVDRIKSKIISNEKVLDGWTYWSENIKTENSTFIWFDDTKDKFEIKTYDSKDKIYRVLNEFSDKETCFAHFIKYQIEETKLVHFKNLKLDRESFQGFTKAQNIVGLWNMSFEQKIYNSSYYPLTNLDISFDKIELKTFNHKRILFSFEKKHTAIIEFKKSIQFLICESMNPIFNKITFYGFSSHKILYALKKFDWVE